MIQDLRDYRPNQLVAGTCAIGFSDCTGHENGNVPWGYLIFFDDVPVRLFKLRKIKRGTGKVRPLLPFFLIAHGS